MFAAVLSGMPMLYRIDARTPDLPESDGNVQADRPERQERHGAALGVLDVFRCAAVALALLGSAPSWAQTIYRSNMPDGRVIFGDRPVAGAATVEPIDTASLPTNVVPSSTRNQDAAQQRELRRQQQAARQAEIRDAKQALRAAEAAQTAGKEPLPGERRGNVGGGSRLTEEYWARQKALKAAVTEARKRLDAARRAAR